APRGARRVAGARAAQEALESGSVDRGRARVHAVRPSGWRAPSRCAVRALRHAQVGAGDDELEVRSVGGSFSLQGDDNRTPGPAHSPLRRDRDDRQVEAPRGESRAAARTRDEAKGGDDEVERIGRERIRGGTREGGSTGHPRNPETPKTRTTRKILRDGLEGP